MEKGIVIMEIDKKVTAKDIIKFYSEKTFDQESCPLTIKYLTQKTEADSCSKLAELFYNLENNKPIKIFTNGKLKNDDDCLFYLYLKEKQESEKFVFEDEDVEAEVDVFKPYSDYKDKKGNPIISQKWHLLISVYAYLYVANNVEAFNSVFKEIESVVNKNKKLNFEESLLYTEEPSVEWKNSFKAVKDVRPFSSKGLRLWMIETAIGDLSRKIAEREDSFEKVMELMFSENTIGEMIKNIEAFSKNNNL